jgi:Ser/Thr protein kinase RdoA (MazF antagonist)
MVRPALTIENVQAVASGVFGVVAEKVKPLDSYDDQNALITTTAGEQFVLKISNTDFGTDGLEMQNQALLALHGAGMHVPCPVARKDNGKYIADFTDSAGKHFDVRLVTFLPGKLMGHAKQSYSPELLQHLGQTCGQADQVLLKFKHNAAKGRDLEWDLGNFHHARRHLKELGQVQGET